MGKEETLFLYIGSAMMSDYMGRDCIQHQRSNRKKDSLGAFAWDGDVLVVVVIISVYTLDSFVLYCTYLL